MTESDEDLRKRYRELDAIEPPAALDQAILASARRAVAPRAAQRWAMPVSVAAVLVLAVGVTLRMQHEKPGIESAVPNEYSTPPPAEPDTPAPAVAEPPVARDTAAPARVAKAPASPPAEEMRQRAAPAPDPAPGAKLEAQQPEVFAEKKKDTAERNQASEPKAFADSPTLAEKST